ncbi:hypothetical protein NHX12_030359, partial [Muraenolepis orangiensis]
MEFHTAVERNRRLRETQYWGSVEDQMPSWKSLLLGQGPDRLKWLQLAAARLLSWALPAKGPQGQPPAPCHQPAARWNCPGMKR